MTEKHTIIALQEENKQKNLEITAQMQLLDQYKRALDASSIISKTDITGIITYVNDKFCEISGYSREELIGKSHNIVHHADMPNELFYELWETIKANKTYHAVIKNKKKSGDFYYVDTTIVPIVGADGKIIEYFSIRHDLTDLIKAKEHAISAEKAKSTFLSTMSHELRTPLNAVIGFSQILLTKDTMPFESLKIYIGKINSSGKHLLNVVNNLLEFSKIESGKIDFNQKSINLHDLILAILPSVEAMALSKNIAIEQQNLADGQLYIDEQLFKQALTNLLSNAVKFTANNKRITLSYMKNDKFHIISICDEGFGLTKEQIEIIFDPFTQIQEHQNGLVKGTGLGLAITQKIMELHHAYIKVESEPNVGSCFHLYLPQ